MLMSHQTAYYSKFIGSQLYKEYCETVKKPVVARAYRKWMKKIIGLGLVKDEGKKRWRRYEIVI